MKQNNPKIWFEYTKLILIVWFYLNLFLVEVAAVACRACTFALLLLFVFLSKLYFIVSLMKMFFLIINRLIMIVIGRLSASIKTLLVSFHANQTHIMEIMTLDFKIYHNFLAAGLLLSLLPAI